MNNILLTFDYEIYFDGSNRYLELIENTNRILEISYKANVKLIFFIDVLYLMRLKDLNRDQELHEISEQIRQIKEKDHELQYHYHPHWINATFSESENQWEFDKTEFSFSDICSKYGIPYALANFDAGLNYLRSTFKCDAITYRAGGLSIDNNQKELIENLIKNKIKFDSSVMPGLELKGKYLNASHKLSDLGNWQISAESGFFADEKSSISKIQEIPIMTMQKFELSLYQRILPSIKYRFMYQVSKLTQNESKTTGKRLDLEFTSSSYPINITFDKSKPQDLILMKFFTKQYLKNKGPYLCILSHPKSFYQNSFDVLFAYIEWIKKERNSCIFSGFEELK